MPKALARILLAVTTLVGLVVTTEVVRSLFTKLGAWTVGRSGETEYTVGATQGSIYLSRFTTLPDVWLGLGTDEWRRQQAQPFEDRGWAGFRFVAGQLFITGPTTKSTLFKSRIQVGAIAVPGWVLCPVLLAWPASVARRQLKRRRRVRAGHCVKCGYDLRASAGRCPECGAAAAPPDVNVAR